MLAVTAFWSNDSFRLNYVSDDIAEAVPSAFIKAYPEGAAMVKKHIESRKLTKSGKYVFVTGEDGRLLGYERVRDNEG
jgi:hypothetical protein